jgi:arginyl-tRNA synthetase
MHEIEAGGNATAEMGEYISNKIVNCHLNTMTRLDISYDLLARESEILHLHFWAHAYDKLKERGVIVFENEGRNKGCWVMRAEDDGGTRGQGEGESEHDADKIIVRSNGTVTYTGKDIAYHLWKLGKLGLDFNYQHLRNDHHGHPVWVTTGVEGSSEHPAFGNGTAYMNVIDVGQSYPQANVKRAVMLMAESDEQRAKVARSAHLAYEKVTLSADAARELGVSGEGSVSMSGRKGLGVKADDLIDRLEANALTEVQARHADLSVEEQRQIAHKIAVAALRYFLLKYTRTSIIAFDFTEALSFTGETGPYILNSVVRAKSILRKLGQSVDEVRTAFGKLSAEQLQAVFAGESGNALWTAVYFAARLDDAIQQASLTLEPNHVVKHTFQLAKQFHLFYESHHILSETDEAKKLTLLMIADLLRRKLEFGLSLLGIEVPEKM